MTFSIVARDARTGAIGVATATGGPVVGSLVPHARARIGVIATQGFTTNPFYGFDGLRELETGRSAAETRDILVNADPGRERRQLLILDTDGRSAVWTGRECRDQSGSILRSNVAVAGNLLASDDVLSAMVEAFDHSMDRPLEDRLLAALLAGNARGGDRRGTRSAAIKVYLTELYPAIDLRVDWSDTPVEALSGILSEIRNSDYATFFARLPTVADPFRS